MKKRDDPRHVARIRNMQDLFSYDFDKKPKAQTREIIANLAQIDAIIEECAPTFPVEKIAKVDLAILRLAIYELIILKKNPPKVIIDEAVELAKEFGNDTSGSFINGVLGTVLVNTKKYGIKNT